MKHLPNFIEFINEAKKLNEGGGAGIEYKMDSVDITVQFQIDAKKVRITKTSSDIADSFDASGYDDGMDDVRTKGILKIDDKELKNLDSKFFYDIEFMESKNISKLFKLDSSWVEENMVGTGYMDSITFKKLFELNPDIKLKGELKIYFENIASMTGRGWTRKSEYKVGDDLFYVDDSVADFNEIELTLNGVDFTYSSSDVDMRSLPEFHIKADKEFNNFYQDVFNFDPYSQFENPSDGQIRYDYDGNSYYYDSDKNMWKQDESGEYYTEDEIDFDDDGDSQMASDDHYKYIKDTYGS